MRLRGWAFDNLAIRVVRWRDEAGHAGTARLRWIPGAGDETAGWQWRTEWVVSGVPLRPGANRITVRAEDIKGLPTETTVTVQG